VPHGAIGDQRRYRFSSVRPFSITLCSFPPDLRLHGPYRAAAITVTTRILVAGGA
jgi:hypothetical protein